MKLQLKFAFFLASIFLAGCFGHEQSQTTGWNYNDEESGGYEVRPYVEQETGPGLVLIEGGTFVMGRTEQDVMHEWDNMPRRVTVNSYYMDETEVRNVDYREYLYWLRRIFGDQYPEVYEEALPDTTVWRRRLAYNEPYVKYYLRHPAFNDYPVVGVSWVQADKYCQWRTDRVNEKILYRENILEKNPQQEAGQHFTTSAYLARLYDAAEGKGALKSYNPDKETRHVKISDGILLPRYRLPSEAEWEYAALGLIGNSVDERIYSRRIYPWNGHYTRRAEDDAQGQFMANFQRGNGDMMGVAGYLNDNAAATNRVDAYWPNDFGLYCMAGNVNEWVLDVYRPLNNQDMNEFNPFRGNVFKTRVKEDGKFVRDEVTGRVKERKITKEEAMKSSQYTKADNINYADGDDRSRVRKNATDWTSNSGNTNAMYYRNDTTNANIGVRSLISDQSRVYKGGGWRDRAYWLSPGTRRFLDQNMARDDLGFRCAMIRVGPNPDLANR